MNVPQKMDAVPNTSVLGQVKLRNVEHEYHTEHSNIPVFLSATANVSTRNSASPKGHQRRRLRYGREHPRLNTQLRGSSDYRSHNLAPEHFTRRNFHVVAKFEVRRKCQGLRHGLREVSTPKD
jgi:hypothetical protein